MFMKSNLKTRSGLRGALNTAAALGALGLSGPALGQVVERHEAPGLQQAPAAPVAAPEPPANEDATPLGANLASVNLLRAEAPAPGFASEAVAQTPLSDAPNQATLDRKLARFAGQPLSRALIARIEAVVVDHYRQAGRPFVAVKLPPQDLTQGVLSQPSTDPSRPACAPRQETGSTRPNCSRISTG